MASYIARRKFLATLLGGAAAWPMTARAQQGGRMRRIGVLMRGSADDSDEQARLTAFLQGLEEWGWSDGRNVRIDVRWSAADPDRRRRYAAELVALSRMSSSPIPVRSWRRYRRRPKSCRSYSRGLSTRSAPASSRAWHGRAGTRRVLPCSTTVPTGNGWSYLKR